MIKSSSDLFLVDGFPRALDQAETFERDILPCQMVCPASSFSDLSVCVSVRAELSIGPLSREQQSRGVSYPVGCPWVNLRLRRAASRCVCMRAPQLS